MCWLCNIRSRQIEDAAPSAAVPGGDIAVSARPAADPAGWILRSVVRSSSGDTGDSAEAELPAPAGAGIVHGVIAEQS